MMRSLSNELSTRARALLERDGHKSVVHGADLGGELKLATLTLWTDERGTLCVEQTYTHKTIYMESPNRTVIRTSPDNILKRAIDELRQNMILEDMADV